MLQVVEGWLISPNCLDVLHVESALAGMMVLKKISDYMHTKK